MSTSYFGVVVFTVMVLVANVKILFISSLYYVILLAFILLSVLLWVLTLATISAFVSFPAESFDLYGSFWGMIGNPVAFRRVPHFQHTALVVLFLVVLLSIGNLLYLSLDRTLRPSPAQVVNVVHRSPLHSRR